MQSRRDQLPRYLLPLLVAAVVILAVGVLLDQGPGGSPSPTAGQTTSSPASTPSATDSPGETATGSPASGSITVYSGRSEELVGPLLEEFTRDTGIEVNVRYGDTAEMASTILEEGDNSPADVFYGQDAGALGALAAEARLSQLPDDLLDRVDDRFESVDGLWIGTSGRARVAVYSTEQLTAADMPASILEFTDPKWKGRLGWAPTNGSFQAFVTALRVLRGEEAARAWLEGIQANEPTVYEGNAAIVEAVGAGEIEVGFVNHYYLMQIRQEQGADFPAENHFFTAGDPGALVNVAGAGIVTTSANPEAARAFVDYLLSEKAQRYFAEETFEYPMIEAVPADERLVPLAEIQSPDIDLSQLSDLAGTLRLLQEVGVL